MTNFTLASLETLDTLNLDLNRLSNLNLNSLNGLIKLTLSYNQFTTIPLINEFPSLMILNMSYNKLTGLNQSMFSKLISLSILDLRGNQIKQINSNCFSLNIQLSSLQLSNNFLSSVPNISNLNSLSYFDVSNQNGRLKSIASYSFARNSENQVNLTVEMSNNRIEKFSPKMLCSYTTPKISIVKLKIDCNLNVSNCVYSNLELLLNPQGYGYNTPLSNSCLNAIYRLNSTNCLTDLNYKFYDIATEYSLYYEIKNIVCSRDIVPSDSSITGTSQATSKTTKLSSTKTTTKLTTRKKKRKKFKKKIVNTII